MSEGSTLRSITDANVQNDIRIEPRNPFFVVYVCVRVDVMFVILKSVLKPLCSISPYSKGLAVSIIYVLRRS